MKMCLPVVPVVKALQNSGDKYVIDREEMTKWLNSKKE